MASFDLHVSSKMGVRPGFEILGPVSVKYYQRDAVHKISEILQICPDDAFTLLKCFRWCGDHVLDGWFDGLIDTSKYLLCPSPNDDEFCCGICFDTLPILKAAPSLCGHLYCKGCMKAYLSVLVKDHGSTVLDTKCPHEKCDRTLGLGLVKASASPRDFEKYRRFSMRSYIEDSTTRKWCPSPNCNCAIALKDPQILDVECYQHHRFCWQCNWEGHYPADCSIAINWLSFEHNEKCNNWKKVNARLCPNCMKPIHRESGCNHMSCRCGFEFCWVCLRRCFGGGWHYPCIPPVSTSSTGVPEEMQLIPPVSDIEVRYRSIFDLRGKICEKAEIYCRTFHTVQTKMAWFEIRRCLSISKWICALASFYGLDLNQFVKIQEGAQNQLEILISCAIGEAPDIRIEDCTQKTRELYEQMVARLQWEGQWNV